LVNKYKNNFIGVGKFKKPYHIEIEENAKPVVNPIRKVPFALHEQLKKHLNELENTDIIRKVEGCAEWVNSSQHICLGEKRKWFLNP
jgi:hypothetical protein